jgi:hypothetical protein
LHLIRSCCPGRRSILGRDPRQIDTAGAQEFRKPGEQMIDDVSGPPVGDRRLGRPIRHRRNHFAEPGRDRPMPLGRPETPDRDHPAAPLASSSSSFA